MGEDCEQASVLKDLSPVPVKPGDAPLLVKIATISTMMRPDIGLAPAQASAMLRTITEDLCQPYNGGSLPTMPQEAP